MERSCDSSPQSLTTTQLQLTTFRALPSRSIWPASPKCQQNTPNPISHPHLRDLGLLTQHSPLAQLLPIRHLDERNVVLGTQRHDQLLVRLLLARLIEHAHVGLAPVERFTGFAEPAREPVVDEGDFEDALQCVQHAHAAAFVRCFRADFDFVRRWDFDVGLLFSVRLWGRVLVFVMRCDTVL